MYDKICSMMKHPDIDLPESGLGEMVHVYIEMKQRGNPGKMVVKFGSLKMSKVFPRLAEAYDCFITMGNQEYIGYNFLKLQGFKEELTQFPDEEN